MINKKVIRISILTALFTALFVIPSFAAGIKDFVKDDFSDKANGTPLEAGTNDGNWNLIYSGLGRVDVPQVTYEDGAIKISKSAGGANVDLYKDMQQDNIPTSGKVVYSFDVKYSPFCNHQTFASDFVFRLAPDLANMGDRKPLNQLFYSLHFVDNGLNGGHLFFKDGVGNTFGDFIYAKDLVGTAFDWYHFEYTIDYDSNKYSVKINDIAIPFNEDVTTIPQGFIDNGGGKFFQTVLVTSNLSASVPNLEMYLKNFKVTTGETMWPKTNALTVDGVSSDSATLTWNPQNADGVTGYEIYQNDTLLETITTPGQTSYTVTGLSGNKEYTFSVKPMFSDAAVYDSAPSIRVMTEGVTLRENKFRHLSAGRMHIVGLNNNAAIKAWGGNSMGQADDGITKPLIGVSSGAFSSYTTDSKGNVYAWGNNYEGQLGIGSSELTVATPTIISKLSNVTSIAAGKEHALALTEDGKVYAWGNNVFGQLGTGNSLTLKNTTEPVEVSALSDKHVTGVFAGEDTSFAVCQDGTLYGWGMNYVCQLVDADLDYKDIPGQINIPDMKVLSIAAGSGHTIALCYSEAEGKTSLWGWGNDGQAQLGTGDLGSIHSTPVRLTFFDNLNIKEISAGNSHTLALSDDGSVYAWGNNESGQLGTGGGAYGLSPERVQNIPFMATICAGYDFSAAATADGTLWAWGSNAYGQINQNGESCYSLPVRVDLSAEDFGCVAVNLSDGQNTYDRLPENGGNYNLNIDYYNRGVGFDAKLLVAIYTDTEQGTTLVDSVSKDITVPTESMTESISVPIVLPADMENVMVKVFVWDKNSNAPYTTAVRMISGQ